MKMSRPTSVTMTSMMAERGSRTQPRSTLVVPNCSQVKLTTSRAPAPCAQSPTVCTKAIKERSSDRHKEEIARVAAAFRFGRFSSAVTPDAIMGSRGIRKSDPAMKEFAGSTNCGWNGIPSCITIPSPLHPVHLVQVGCFGVAINLNHQAQSYCGFGRGYGYREDGEHHAGERFRVAAVAPKGYEIQIG